METERARRSGEHGDREGAETWRTWRQGGGGDREGGQTERARRESGRRDQEGDEMGRTDETERGMKILKDESGFQDIGVE